MTQNENDPLGAAKAAMEKAATAEEKTQEEATVEKPEVSTPQDSAPKKTKGKFLARVLGVSAFLRAAGKYYGGLKSSLKHNWDKYALPAWEKAEPYLGWAADAAKWTGKTSLNLYKAADKKFSFRTGEDGERERDYLRTTAVAGMAALAAFGVVTQAIPTAYKYTGGVVTDGIHLMVGAQELKDVVLFDPQPVDGVPNLYRAKLCFDSACGKSTYVNFKENAFLSLHSRLTDGFKPYRPKQEVETIATTGSSCASLKLYGIQMKGRDWYQNVSAHTCKPMLGQG